MNRILPENMESKEFVKELMSTDRGEMIASHLIIMAEYLELIKKMNGMKNMKFNVMRFAGLNDTDFRLFLSVLGERADEIRRLKGTIKILEEAMPRNYCNINKMNMLIALKDANEKLLHDKRNAFREHFCRVDTDTLPRKNTW